MTDRAGLRLNFGCFNSNVQGWLGVDVALRHVIVSRLPFAAWILWKAGLFNNEQYAWHRQEMFKTVVYGDAAKPLRFKSDSADYIYSSHMLEHLYRDDALRFMSECRRVLRPGGVLRLCVPDWDSARGQKDFKGMLFARNEAELKHSHKWLWQREELVDALVEAGFSRVDAFGAGEGDFPDRSELEKREGVAVQAVK